MNAEIRRTRRGRLTAVLLALMTLGLLHLAPAQADTSATSTCTLDPTRLQCPVTRPPADLLGPDTLAAATPAQATSLRRLSVQAVDNTLADHGLPASDRDAAAGWARSDAQAELFALIVKAIQTAESDRSTDQQQAVDWMRELVRAKAERAAQHAGAEYATWAGLDLNDYWRIVKDPTSTESDVRDFLSGPVSPYNTDDPSQATSGYCIYQPPEPYQDDYQEDYDSSTFQTCYSPCSTPFGCQPVTPQYDDFVDWGNTAAAIAEPSGQELGIAWSQIAVSATFGTAVIAAVSGIVSTAVLESLLPLGSLLPLFATPLVVEGLGLSTAGGTASSVGWLAAEAAAAGGAVAVVIMAVVIATLEGIKVADAAALPGKLASLVVGARTADPGLAAQLDTDDGAAGIFAMFVEATMPLPRLGGDCNGTTASTDLGTRPCLNPPDVPAPALTDPHFVVRDVKAGTFTTSPTITVFDPKDSTSATVRVHGSWFVARMPGTDTEVESLRLGYPDLTGRRQRVWLMRDTNGRYLFVGVTGDGSTPLDTDTCKSDGTCWAGRTIDYLGPDGRAYQASVEPYRPPGGTPAAFITSASGEPVEGSPVTFRANNFVPAGAVYPVSYTWRFQKEDCGIPCTTVTSTGGADGGASTGPLYLEPVSGPRANGDEPTHTWQTSGTYSVQVTATDLHGQQAVTAFPVRVAGIPPVLAIDTVEASASPGGQVTLRGTVDHVGQLDNERVDIDWGDNSGVDVAGAGPNTVNLVGNPLTIARLSATRYALEAHHAYEQAGTYDGTVTVVDQAGHTDRRRFTFTVS